MIMSIGGYLMRSLEDQDDRTGTGVYSCSQPGAEGIGF